MDRSCSIERPGARADHPRAWPLVFVFVIAFAAGVWLVLQTLDVAFRPSSEIQQDTKASPRSQASAKARETPPVRSTTFAITSRESPSTGPAKTTTTTNALAARPAQAVLSERDRRVKIDRVAYLRCDGAPQQRGPYPCPRDREFETAVWDAIASLPSCPGVPAGRGELDLRVQYRQGEPVSLHMESIDSGLRGLDGSRAVACVENNLVSLRPRLQARRAVISFRFAMVPRS